jgi:hypothetical protein
MTPFTCDIYGSLPNRLDADVDPKFCFRRETRRSISNDVVASAGVQRTTMTERGDEIPVMIAPRTDRNASSLLATPSSGSSSCDPA